MRNMGHRLRKLVTILDDAGIVITGTGIIVMSFLIAANTALRYLFDRPWCFAEEYSGYLVVMVTFLGLGYTLKEGGHITIDVVINRLSKRARAGLAVLTTAVSLVVTGILFWYGLALALSSLQNDIHSSTVMLTPLWVPQMFVVLGLLIFALELVAQLAAKISELGST